MIAAVAARPIFYVESNPSRGKFTAQCKKGLQFIAECYGGPYSPNWSRDTPKLTRIHSKNERCFEEPKRVLQLVPNREPFLVLRRTLLEGSLEEPYHMVLWRTLGFFTDICSGFFREPFEGSPGNLIASTHHSPMVLQGTPKTYKGSWRNLVI